MPDSALSASTLDGDYDLGIASDPKPASVRSQRISLALQTSIERAFKKLKKHAFFRDWDFNKLENRETVPPYVPDPGASHFDARLQLEEAFLETDPLELVPLTDKHASMPENSLPSEERKWRREFKTFDYYIYEKYLGYVDRSRFCVGDPPDWVKPAGIIQTLQPLSTPSAKAFSPTAMINNATRSNTQHTLNPVVSTPATGTKQEIM